MKILFVTGNVNKIPIAQGHLDAFGVEVEQIKLDLDEIQSTSVEVVARHKAVAAFAAVGQPLFVEDSGMFIDEFGGWPGPMVKQLVTAVGARGLTHLADLTTGRACSFIATLAYVDENGTVHTFTEHGEPGTIASTPAVDGAFGTWSPLWDVFIPPGADVPLSILPEQERQAIFDEWSTRSVFAQFGRWLGGTPLDGDAPTACGDAPSVEGPAR
ncbi:non-canonical purine NTP pyrophosphatase [Longispora albida]|uniref:non-canonical purine NTP pyrophosphatase n=1 Tax=Longispora albida TaxID=203523 RepID=UPI0003684244|nr:non-canonical purine NTP pyrophosphatase [Longispora albida]